MSRQAAIAMLQAHKAFDADENRNRLVAIHMLQTVPDVFLRECNNPGHICGSAMVCNMDGSRMLLNQHGLEGVYMNFGGHADGQEDVFAVAKRELEEESGITNALCSGELFDIDVHYSKPHMRKGEAVPEHIQADFTWLFRVPDDISWVVSDESLDIRWFTLAEAIAMESDCPAKDAQMKRFYKKIAAGLF